MIDEQAADPLKIMQMYYTPEYYYKNFKLYKILCT